MLGDELRGTIRWRVYIPVPIKKVYEALDSSQGRAAFWAESAEEKDTVITFKFINGIVTESQILSRQRPHKWEIEYFGSVARFELTPDGKSGTDLLLVNEGVDPADWHEVYAGWLNVLFPLKAWLTHNVDLRSHDPNRTWEQGYIDQ